MRDPLGGLGGVLCMISGFVGEWLNNRNAPPKPAPKPEPPHPMPHRDPKTGKIVIENCKLYYSDVSQYGAWQAQKWAEKGKYNLEPEELEKERKRLEAEYKELCRLAR